MLPLRDSNPTRTRPVLTYTLIVFNVLIFAFQMSLDARGQQILHYRYGVVPALLTDQIDAALLITPLTSMFMHGDVMHLATNMWFLHIFGDNVEDAMGRARYLFFFVACGVLAAVAHLLVDPSSTIPMVGASGAIAGVLAAYFKLYPGARILTWLLFIFEMPALFFIIIWFAAQIFYGLQGLGHTGEGGIAFFAHIGGFLAGLVLLRWVGTERPIRRDFHRPA